MATLPPVRWSSPNQPGLIALLQRLDSLSQQSWFHPYREQAMQLALRPYRESANRESLVPLPEEEALAFLYACLDYRSDGQPPLIEALDLLAPNHSLTDEEREWLPPLSRSYLDVLEIIQVQTEWPQPTLLLRSLGDGQEDWVSIMEPDPVLQKGRMVLTRIVRGQTANALPGAAVILAHGMGQTLFSFCDEFRRELEADTGILALEDWPTFAKSYGYLLLWSLAKVRQGVTKVAESNIQYFTSDGQPLLFAIAIYEHHEFRFLVEEVERWEGWEPIVSEQDEASRNQIRVWVQKAGSQSVADAPFVVARLTITPILVIIEADSSQRLETIKRQLAATFGFSLAFRGETTTPPPHTVPQVDLLSDIVFTPAITISPEDEYRMLADFLETIWFRWAEEPCPALGGITPRYAVKSGRAKDVLALIDQLERDDLARRRTGKAGYDYNKLRAHLGL
ncbi:MAG: hypothetical protein D6690_11840 [Nitrospirae bacterium]|nr:MAG: hypothetical protein D6690_11840 [Nitrospirota bacterium]